MENKRYEESIRNLKNNSYFINDENVRIVKDLAFRILYKTKLEEENTSNSFFELRELL